MAEIRWVDRDAEGKIKGHYARRQGWHTDTDFVTEDSAELVEFELYKKNPDIRLPLEDFTKKQVAILDTTVKDYVYTKYPIHRQISLQKLQTDARLGGKTEAADYTELVWTWMSGVFEYYYTKEDEIKAIATNGALTDNEKKTAIFAVLAALDLTGFDATDPVVTIRETITKMQAG